MVLLQSERVAQSLNNTFIKFLIYLLQHTLDIFQHITAVYECILQLFRWINLTIFNICTTVNAFLKTIHTNRKTLDKASLLLKIIGSSLKTKYVSMNVPVPSGQVIENR